MCEFELASDVTAYAQNETVVLTVHFPFQVPPTRPPSRKQASATTTQYSHSLCRNRFKKRNRSLSFYNFSHYLSCFNTTDSCIILTGRFDLCILNNRMYLIFYRFPISSVHSSFSADLRGVHVGVLLSAGTQDGPRAQGG